MSDGLNIKASVPWTLVAAAVVGLLFMYRDVQNMKESMVKAERIASLETEVANLKAADAKHESTHGAMWRSLGDKVDR